MYALLTASCVSSGCLGWKWGPHHTGTPTVNNWRFRPVNWPWYIPHFSAMRYFLVAWLPLLCVWGGLRQEELDGLFREIKGGPQLIKISDLVSECTWLLFICCISAGGVQAPSSFTSKSHARQGSERPLPTFTVTQFLHRTLTFPVSYGKILIFFPLLKQQWDIKLKNNVNLHFLLLGELFAPNG